MAQVIAMTLSPDQNLTLTATRATMKILGSVHSLTPTRMIVGIPSETSLIVGIPSGTSLIQTPTRRQRKEGELGGIGIP